VLWRAGLRIQEALSLAETDLDQRRGSILVRHGKNDRRREVGMDAWAWSAIEPLVADRTELPVGPLFCVIDGPTRGERGQRARRGSSCTSSRSRQECGGGSPRTSCATRTPLLLHQGIPLPFQRQLGHSHLSTTGTYLQGIDTEEIISTVHARRAPMMHTSAGLALSPYRGSAPRAPAPVGQRFLRGKQQPGVSAPSRSKGLSDQASVRALNSFQISSRN
jgi:integrase